MHFGPSCHQLSLARMGHKRILTPFFYNDGFCLARASDMW